MAHAIRTYGDPVLKAEAAPVTDVDGKLVRLVDEMFESLYQSDNGVALAAPQIGIQKQIFVWDLGEGDKDVLFNPEIVESDGEWVFEEGCLSIPGLFVEIARPKTVLIKGIGIDGDEVQYEADEFEARMFQHELDHLHGVLMFDRMTPDQRKQALAEFRKLQREATEPGSAAPRKRRLRLS
jgi:peptide deformylase